MEYLVCFALSLALLHGRIDSVDEVIARGLRKAAEVAVARLNAVSVSPVDDNQVGCRSDLGSTFGTNIS